MSFTSSAPKSKPKEDPPSPSTTSPAVSEVGSGAVLATPDETKTEATAGVAATEGTLRSLEEIILSYDQQKDIHFPTPLYSLSFSLATLPSISPFPPPFLHLRLQPPSPPL